MLSTLFERWTLKANACGNAQYWDTWHKEARAKYPIRYFLQQTAPRQWNRRVVWPLRRAIWWVRYHTINRNNIIRIRSLSPAYHDEDTLMLHGCFQLLVNYVEIGLSGLNYSWHEANSSFLNRWKSRCPEAGLDYLDWAINDESTQATSQAEDARQHKALYLWWTIERPARLDPWTSPQIWGDAKIDEDFTAMRHQARIAAGKISTTTDELYAVEDQAMLERLLKVRRSMWT